MTSDPPATGDPPSPRGWRGSRETWLDAAHAALTAGGVDAVKILPLAQGLGLSRTSFYWFFKDRGDLLAALLERWEAATTRPLTAATSAYAATETEAMLNVIAIFLSEDGFASATEGAVRAWAQQDAAVAARLAAADAERLDALRAMLMRWGHDAADADTRARTVYLVQIGYISMRVEEDREERLARFPHYVEIYTGRRPAPGEMERIRAGLPGPPR
ncbi:TetR/AcrR family transcriptional regulator [Mangrovicoccus algicola]|uniref:TetR/AcrR family transcriptional regulator n=1 Tax=Mangrovicoccus algicola TaxID=2771008 RepID=A0A8J7CXB5_9RHOB|nr:TetR/AcrR family transcriptional regulator [Mangrovicoccus algicola]MBE3640364.1 TetR/AcrR family transcriptional regulator [Mangrovicoccus algicola]